MTTHPATAAATFIAWSQSSRRWTDGEMNKMPLTAYYFAEAVQSLTAQLTAANERADKATAEAAVLLDAVNDVLKRNEIQHWFDTSKQRAALELAPLAAAFLADHRRLVEGQRTKGATEICWRCTTPSKTEWAECTNVHCPIRAGGT